MSEVEAITPEVLSAGAQLPRDPLEGAMVVHQDGSVERISASPITNDDLAMLESLGMIVPIMLPDKLRAAFALRQRMYAAVLDPSDYIYTVSYRENVQGKERDRQYISSRRADAQKMADTYGVPMFAKPKKSGIVKLARALGIEAKRISTAGLPGDPRATYSYVEYEAVHKATGVREIGVAWCDNNEKGGRISAHDIIATADTRAYNRAILRLSGFGEVSADEVIAGASDSDDLPQYVPEPVVRPQGADPLPDATSDPVKTAARAWAEGIQAREDKSMDRFVGKNDQRSQVARMLRAKARRGDAAAASTLGIQGFDWRGIAQDDPRKATFEVEESPVRPEQLRQVRDAAKTQTQPTSAPTPQAAPSQPAPQTASQEIKKAEAATTAPAADQGTSSKPPPTMAIPKPDPETEVISTNQSKAITDLLLPRCKGDKPAAIAWLKANAHVSTTRDVRSNQYEAILKALKEGN